MSDATLKQGKQVLKLIEDSGLSRFDLQRLIDSGLLTDLLRHDAMKIDRNEFIGFLRESTRRWALAKVIFSVEISAEKAVSGLRILDEAGISSSHGARELIGFMQPRREEAADLVIRPAGDFGGFHVKMLERCKYAATLGYYPCSVESVIGLLVSHQESLKDAFVVVLEGQDKPGHRLSLHVYRENGRLVLATYPFDANFNIHPDMHLLFAYRPGPTQS